MDMQSAAKKRLTALGYDFRAFTMESFIGWLEAQKGRQIIPIPWKMPLGMFGAWISDGELPFEYIFYRHDVPHIHQIHIQLHEMAHFLCDHPTIKIDASTIKASLIGNIDTSFLKSALLRSESELDLHRAEFETEAETLANLIQERVIYYSRLEELTRSISSDQKMAQFIKTMGMA